MGALATCTVVRPNKQYLSEPLEVFGFNAEEESYSGTILFFENAKAYVVKNNNGLIYWVNVKLLTNVTPIN